MNDTDCLFRLLWDRERASSPYGRWRTIAGLFHKGLGHLENASSEVWVTCRAFSVQLLVQKAVGHLENLCQHVITGSQWFGSHAEPFQCDQAFSVQLLIHSGLGHVQSLFSVIPWLEWFGSCAKTFQYECWFTAVWVA